MDSITYDPFINLTTSITSTDVTKLTHGANSQRTLKNDDYASIAYIHGLSDFPLMEKIDYDGQPEVTKLYVYGPTGLLAVNDDDGWFFMLKDHIGSTRAVLNESNSVVTSFDFMPFGNIMRSSVGTEVTYQFTGQEYDTELSLHNFRARMYDSDLGMFYAVDPAGQGFSSFGYAGNNPVIYVDKDGKSFLLALGIAALVGATTNAVIYSATTDNWNWSDFGTSALIGGGTAALGFAAAALAPAGIVPGALWGFGSGGLIGGTAAELSGGNFETGFWWGGAFGFVGGGFRGYQLSKQQNLGMWLGEKLPTPKNELYPVGLSNPRVGKAYNEVFDNKLKLANDRTTTAITKWYPENDGFLGNQKTIMLQPGQQIDRYGVITGRYFSPAGTPLQMRSLPPNFNTSYYNRFQVVNPFPVQSGTITPFFNQPGMGTQYFSPYFSAEQLWRGGFIKLIP